MNKIYRLVWNSTQRSWVVACEFAGARGKGASSLRQAKRLGGLSGAIAASLISFPAEAWVAGSGTSSTALDNNMAGNTSINSGRAISPYNNSIAIGPQSFANDNHSIAMGVNSKATGDYALAIGGESQALWRNSIALGGKAIANSANAIAIGTDAVAKGDSAIALGNWAQAYDTASIAIGGATVALPGKFSIAIGNNAATTNSYAVAIGAHADAYSEYSTALGAGALVSPTSTHGTALGNNSFVYGIDGTALGYYAIVNNADDVALGSRSTTASTVATSGTNINGVGYTFAGITPTSTVSVGVEGNERTITNVAAGRISSSSTDAVNGSQLFASNQAIESAVNNIVTTGTKYFHANSTGADSSATGLDAVAIGMGAIASHIGSIALGAGSVADGSTLGNAAYLVGGSATGELNIGERRITGVSAGALDTDAVNVAQLKAVATAASSGATDNRAIKYDWTDTNGDGIAQTDEIDYTKASLAGGGGTVISNLADGTVAANSSDAINGSQLYNVAGDTSNENITNNGRGVRYVRTNDTDMPLADAKAQGKASTAVGYNATASAEGSLALGQDSSASALNSIAIGKGAQADTAQSVALGEGATTQTAVSTSEMTIRGNTYAVAGIAPVGTVSIGDEGQERTITNVAAGRVTGDSTDAINGSQLYATVTAINNITAGIINLDDAAVKYERHADGSVNYNKVVLAGGSTQITNLAAGTENSDAVNYSQLKTVATQVTNIANGTDGMFQVNNTSNHPKPAASGKDSAAGGAGSVASGDNSLAIGTKSRAEASNSVALGANSIADRANTVSMGSVGSERQITNVAAGTQGTDAVNVNQLKSGVASANQYTDNKFNSLKNMVDDQGDKLSAGIAGAMAMAGLPQAYQPGASMVAMSGSTYQSQSAVALGVSMISDNGKWVTKLSGSSNTQGDLGGAVGVGYQW